MKAVIFWDSHGDVEIMVRVIEKEKPEIIIHLGDGKADENRISSRNNMLKLIDEHDADILMHGHSHEAFMHRTKAISGKTCWIMNPGSISREKNVIAKPIYAVLKIKNTGACKWEFKEVEWHVDCEAVKRMPKKQDCTEAGHSAQSFLMSK